MKCYISKFFNLTKYKKLSENGALRSKTLWNPEHNSAGCGKRK